MDVDFSDVLAAGMKWRAESLQISDTVSTNYQVNAYANENSLAITGLTIPATASIQISAQAFFDENATENTVYSSRGLIEYVNLNGLNKSLTSCDRYTLNACASTSVATSPTSIRVIPVEVRDSVNKSTYGLGNDIVIRLKIKNENAQVVENIALNISYNEAFTYSTQQPVRYSTNLYGTMTFESAVGVLSITSITLPSSAEGWIEFTLKAPAKTDLEKVYDEDGNMLDVNGNITTDPNKQAIFPLLVGYNFSYDGIDECVEAAFLDANGEIQIPYNNRAKAYIMSNKHVTSKPKQ
jgi:hypothetical protein